HGITRNNKRIEQHVVAEDHDRESEQTAPAGNFCGSALRIVDRANCHFHSSPGGQLLWLVHSDYDFASSAPCFVVTHRLRGLAQLVSPIDNGYHLARLHEVAQQLQILFVQFRNIPDELLTDEPRQQIHFETPTYTRPRFRV